MNYTVIELKAFVIDVINFGFNIEFVLNIDGDASRKKTKGGIFV